ncbi:hypothetical protein Dimus_006305, partial [Dionaea muscipula]
ERDTTLRTIVQTIVPRRLYLAAKGNAYHEYLSSLAQISRLETIRLSQEAEKTKRRRKRARNNLLNGRLSLSPDDILVLTKHDCYRNSHRDQ